MKVNLIEGNFTSVMVLEAMARKVDETSRDLFEEFGITQPSFSSPDPNVDVTVLVHGVEVPMAEEFFAQMKKVYDDFKDKKREQCLRLLEEMLITDSPIARLYELQRDFEYRIRESFDLLLKDIEAKRD